LNPVILPTHQPAVLSTAPSSRTPHLVRTCACLACAYRVRARAVRSLVRTIAPRFSKQDDIDASLHLQAQVTTTYKRKNHNNKHCIHLLVFPPLPRDLIAFNLALNDLKT
jgi:hypothetical protein